MSNIPVIKTVKFTLIIAVLITIHGQETSAQVTHGFDRTIPATALNAEVIRQPSLQVMELQIKPMRLVYVDLPDPKTGEVKKTELWYLVWRSINRPIRKRQGNDNLAVNSLDPLPGPMQFLPGFTLVTYDDPETEIPNQILSDEIIVGAIKKIEKIERVQLNNTVAAIQDFPAAIAEDAEQQAWVYGVATWSKVDAKTDFFKVIMHGFSNGYENKGTVEEPDLWRKVVIQKFTRPGDEFDPNFKEFQFAGDPIWTYQPDSGAKAQ